MHRSHKMLHFEDKNVGIFHIRAITLERQLNTSLNSIFVNSFNILQVFVGFTKDDDKVSKRLFWNRRRLL